MNKKQHLTSLAIALGLCLGSATTRAVPSVSLNVLDSFITVGEAFNVEVWVNDSSIGQDLVAFGFDVNPDAALSAVAGYNGFATGPLWFGTSGSGTYVFDTALPGIVDNNVLLATLSFTANAAGSGTLNVLGSYDALSHGLFYETLGHPIDGSLRITVNAQGVPDSSSIWMAAGAFAGLVALRHRFSRTTT
jgi:hypothetical protein